MLKKLLCMGEEDEEQNRRYAPLPSKGKLDKEKFCKALHKVTEELGSLSTMRLLVSALESGQNPKEAFKLCMRWQTEIMASLGIDPQKNQADAGAISEIVQQPGVALKVQRAQLSMQACLQTAVQMHSIKNQLGDTSPRFPGPPLREPQLTEGPVPREIMMEFFALAEETLLSLETKILLQLEREKRGGLKDPQEMIAVLPLLVIKWQHECFAHCGVDPAVGVMELCRMDFSESLMKDKELIEGKTRFVSICGIIQREITQGDAVKCGPAEERKLKPQKELQSSGKVDRAILVEFFDKTSQLLVGAWLQLLAEEKATPQEQAIRIIKLQREALENVGLEQDFGCRVLDFVEFDHKDDEEVLKKKKKFLKSCEIVSTELKKKAQTAA